jgi:iron complex transport system permease protein
MAFGGGGSEVAGIEVGRRVRALGALPVLAGLLVIAMVVAISLGPVRIPFADTCRILLGHLGIHAGNVPDRFTLVVNDVRLPRVLLAMLAGAGLGVVGAVMQALFRNPLADAGVTGVSSGGAVGAVLVLVTGWDTFGEWTLPVAAFGGSLIALLVVQMVAFMRKDRSPATLLLVGMALTALLGAVVGAIISNAADSQTVRSAVFWLQGDLDAADWSDLRLIAVPVLIATAVIMLFPRELNIMLLGDDQARATGLDVVRVRRLLLVVTAVLTGAIVSVTGVIGFVGLVVPHIVRLLVTSDHRVLLPASALFGAIFLTVADLIARMLFSPVTLQTGVVTALLGAPMFLVLVLRPARGARVLRPAIGAGLLRPARRAGLLRPARGSRR